MLSIKAINAASLNKNLNPTPQNLRPSAISNEISSVNDVLNELGFTGTSTDQQAQELSDKLLEISNIGEDYKDKLEYLDQDKLAILAKNRQLNSTAEELKERIRRDTSIAARRVYQSYLVEVYDALVLSENALATNEAMSIQVQNDQKKMASKW